MDDAASGEYTFIKYLGAVNITELNLNVKEGTNMTIVDGKLIKADNGDTIIGTTYSVGDYMFLYIMN